MENLQIKEATTPLEFLAVWGNAFRDCYKETGKQDFQDLSRVCGDAIYLLRGSYVRFHTSSAGVINGLEAFQKRFQTEVIEQGGNVHQAGRRIEIIQAAIDEIKAPKGVVQTSLF